MAYRPNMINYQYISPERRNRGLGGQITGGGGQVTEGLPNMQELTQKYLQGQPDVSPEKMTEGMLGRFRSEIRPAMDEAVLGAQTHAARSGQAYGDVAGRALGQAVAGIAPAAGDVVAAGTELGTKATMQQQQMAQEMARVDATMQMEQRQFIAQMEAEFQMLDRQLQAQERISMMQARSAEEIARIQQAGQMARQQFLASAQQKANVFAEQQQNWRHAQQLKYLAQAEEGKQTLQRDFQSYLAAQLKQKQPPGQVTVTRQTPTAPNVGAEYGPNRPAPGTGWIEWGGKRYTI